VLCVVIADSYRLTSSHTDMSHIEPVVTKQDAEELKLASGLTT